MNVFSFALPAIKTNNANNAIHYAMQGKKRRENSKHNYCIISPRVIIKATIIIFWHFAYAIPLSFSFIYSDVQPELSRKDTWKLFISHLCTLADAYTAFLQHIGLLSPPTPISLLHIYYVHMFINIYLFTLFITGVRPKTISRQFFRYKILLYIVRYTCIYSRTHINACMHKYMHQFIQTVICSYVLWHTNSLLCIYTPHKHTHSHTHTHNLQ